MARDQAARESLASKGEPDMSDDEEDNKEDIAPSVAVVPVVSSKYGKPLGGSSPDALGRIMLQAIIKNDLSTWIRCLYPRESDEDKKVAAESLTKLRSSFGENGVSDWSAIRFSRVTYKVTDPRRYSLENTGQCIKEFVIEFNYKAILGRYLLLAPN